MKPIVRPNLGLYLDRPSIALNERMLQAGLNFRVKNGQLTNFNLGWDRFESTITLNGPVILVANFFIRGGTEKLIFGTPTDLYQYSPSGHSVAYITPIYATGTASASGTAVLGVGTNWDPEATAGDQISFGSATRTDPAATWYTIASRTDDTHLVLTTSAGTVANGVYTIRKLFNASVTERWSVDTFVDAGDTNEDEWWATNGVDFPIRWNGSDAQVETMSSLGFKAKYLRVYSNMMIYANLTQSGEEKPTDIINSDVGTPSNVSSGLSEQFKVHGGTAGIIRMEPLGDSLVIYSFSNGLGNATVCQFVGDPLVFTFRHALSDLGPVAHLAVANYGDYHVFLGKDSQYTFDGASARESSTQVFKEVIRQQDPVRVSQSYAFFDDENADLVWVVPSTSDPGSGDDDSPPSRAFAEHYLEDVGDPTIPKPISKRTFPFTAQGYYARQDGITWDQLTSAWSTYNFRWNDQFFFAAFPLILVGDEDGKIYTLNTSQNAAGAALESYVRFGRRALMDGRLRGLIARVYPFVTTLTTPLNVTVRMADHAQGVASIIQTDSFDQTLPEGGHFTVPYRRGRYMDLEFGTDGPGEPWELSGYDLEIRPGGKR